MSESGFREVHLSGKQAVFLFMALVVAAVGVFLLGVKVGRGVAPSDQVTQATPTPTPKDDATAAGSPGPLGPATPPAPGVLNYHGELKGKPEDKGTSVQVPASPTPTQTPVTTPTPTSTPAQTPTPTPTSKPTPTATTKPGATPKPESTTAVWWFQVNSFGSRDNALKQVAQLKEKGIPSVIVDTGGSGTRYKVKAGPLDRAAADAAHARLVKEGLKPFPVTR